MTLIIGIRCTDGIVIGSDGAATFALLGQPTIQQPTHGKVHVVPGSMLLGVSGPIGLAQRIESELVRQHASGALTGKPAIEVGEVLRSALWSKILAQEYNIAAAIQPVLGGLAQQDALCAILLAIPTGDRAELIQFDHTGSPEVASDDLPFAAIGVGQTIADPFLAFLKQVFWPKRTPSLAEGTFATLWTLRHAISVHPGGVANPVSLFHLAKKPTGWEARQLDPKDLAEHEEAVAAAEAHLRGFTKQPVPKGPPAPNP